MIPSIFPRSSKLPFASLSSDPEQKFFAREVHFFPTEMTINNYINLSTTQKNQLIAFLNSL